MYFISITVIIVMDVIRAFLFVKGVFLGHVDGVWLSKFSLLHNCFLFDRTYQLYKTSFHALLSTSLGDDLMKCSVEHERLS